MFTSDDGVEDETHASLYPVDFLNSLASSGVPPHRLCLKEGCPVMLLRNMSTALGLASAVLSSYASASTRGSFRRK